MKDSPLSNLSDEELEKLIASSDQAGEEHPLQQLSTEDLDKHIAALQPEQPIKAPFGLTPEVLQQYTGLPFKMAVGTMQAIGEDIAHPLSKLLGRDIKAPTFVSRETPEAKVGEFIAPMMEFEGLGSLLGAGAKAVPALAKLTEGIPGAMARIGGLGAYGAAEAPKGKELQQFLLGSLLGVPGELLGPVLKGIGKSFMAKRTPEAIEEIQQAAKSIPGREAPIRLPAGAVLKSTPLLGAESMLERVPFAGMERPYAQLNKAATDYYGDFIKNLEGYKGGDLHKATFKTVNEGYEKVLNKHQDALDKFINLSETMEKPKKFEHPNMTGVRKDALEEIKQTIAEEGPEQLTEDEEVQKTILKRFNPEKYKFNDFKRFEKIKKNLNKEARKQRRLGNNDSAMLLEELKSGLRKDITENTKGFPELEKSLQTADDIYRDEVVPYRYKAGKKKGRQMQTEFLNALNSGDTKGFINKHLETGGTQDAHEKLQKLLDLSGDSERTKELLLSHHLQKAVSPTGDISPGRVFSEMERLGENQKNILLGPERENFKTFETLFDAIPKSRGIDFDPKTGFKTLKGILSGAAGAAGLTHPGAIAAALGGTRATSELLRSGLLPGLAKTAEKDAIRKFPTALLAPLLTERGEE